MVIAAPCAKEWQSQPLIWCSYARWFPLYGDISLASWSLLAIPKNHSIDFDSWRCLLDHQKEGMKPGVPSDECECLKVPMGVKKSTVSGSDFHGFCVFLAVSACVKKG
ncbi:hypothetical protein BVC80_361g7 [Macleaya cordata]|uniref:Uncharacterized protein n=1 Tax=Macleaya cordata TaxID=56857 RepID=A0A200QNP6_MACCD|nr:hypothetical protein BVC80_361g7 [Macleaya cordata]